MTYPHESEQAVACFYHNCAKPKRRAKGADTVLAAWIERAEKEKRDGSEQADR